MSGRDTEHQMWHGKLGSTNGKWNQTVTGETGSFYTQKREKDNWGFSLINYISRDASSVIEGGRGAEPGATSVPNLSDELIQLDTQILAL